MVVSGEFNGSLDFPVGDVIDFVQQEENLVGILLHILQKIKFRLADRLFDREQKKGRIGVGQVLVGDIGVVNVHGTHARRIHQAHAVFQIRGGIADENLFDSLEVLGITRFRNIVDEFPGGDGRDLSVLEGHLDLQGFSVSQNGDDGGQRHNPGRQQVDSHERIDEARLAPLELADHDQIQGVRTDLFDQLLERKPRQMLKR